MRVLNTILAGLLFSFGLTGLSSASEPSIQPLHHSLTLTGIQNPFEEICRLADVGVSCSYHGFMIESERITDPEGLVQQIQRGFFGTIKLAKGRPEKVSPEAAISQLFGKFASFRGLREEKFQSLKKEMLDSLRTFDARGLKRHPGIFWSLVENGSVILVHLSDSKHGITEIGLLTFGSITDY